MTLTSTLDAFGVCDADDAGDARYVPGTAVSVTAPLAGGSNFFVRWLLDGALLTTSLTASLSGTGAHTLTAVYEPRYVFTVIERGRGHADRDRRRGRRDERHADLRERRAR